MACLMLISWNKYCHENSLSFKICTHFVTTNAVFTKCSKAILNQLSPYDKTNLVHQWTNPLPVAPVWPDEPDLDTNKGKGSVVRALRCVARPHLVFMWSIEHKAGILHRSLNFSLKTLSQDSRYSSPENIPSN